MKFTLVMLTLALAASLRAGDAPRRTGIAQAELFPARGVGLASVQGVAMAFAFADTDKPGQEVISVKMEGSGRKSPWISGGMSLILPGAGEVYTQSYIRGAVFFAAEAASWILNVSNNKKGDDQDALFKAYANLHYNPVRYANWTINNLDRLQPNPPPGHNTAYYTQQVYGSSSEANPDDCPAPFSCISWAALNRMELEVSDGVLNGYTHQMPYYGTQQYFELIGKYEQFSRGWDDSNPSDPAEQLIPVKTTSKRFFEYAAMRSKANDYYDLANTFLGVIVLNHILSAADAFWSATQYNSSLHASVNMHLVPSPLGYIPITEAKLKYDL